MIIPILPQTQFNYSYLVNPGTEDLIIEDDIPVADAKTVSLSVRIHDLNVSAGASFQFLVYGVDPSRSDGTVFITSSTIGSTAAITSSTTNLVGLSSIISEPVYPFIRVVLRATGPSAAGNVYGEFSVDVVVRDACTVSGRTSQEAAFVHDLMQAIHSEPPRASGRLTEFEIGTSPWSGPLTTLACPAGKSTAYPCPEPPKPPGGGGGGGGVSSGLACKILDILKDHSVYKCDK